MEQFRHIGEVLGSLKAMMVLREEIQINQRQCCLILDIFSLAFDTIADEIRQNLKLEERNTKWKLLEFPMRELCRVFKEGELYIRNCLDSKDWWGKALTLYQNRDCVEFHIHNLLCYFPAVIEAIENVGEVSGLDQDEKEKKKVMVSRKYAMEWNDPTLFQWSFGKQYLVPREICEQMENAWREDRWRLIEALKERKNSAKVTLTKNEQRLADMLLNKLLNRPEKMNNELWPISVLTGSKDYHVRRRLGRARDFKEISWLGQSFTTWYFQGERQAHEAEISTLLSLSHPNILQYLCGFYDDDKKEFSLVIEMLHKDLWTYMKENCGPRRQILFSIPIVVDLMLQMARGLEYLHSKKIYHGDLNPCNILLRARNSQEGFFHAKIAGFGLPSVKNGDTIASSPTHNSVSEELNPYIWYAPEVLRELERIGYASTSSCKYSEKADAYSFGMICFELLTGKVPFEDNHLQGERKNQNILAGERPLFPLGCPKYIVGLIKKCWQTDPAQRPTFSSICRILRYTKKFLSMNAESYSINQELNQAELLSPPVDCCDMEATFLKNFSSERASSNSSTVSQIPYEMFAYKVVEKGKIIETNMKDKCCEPAAKGEASTSTEVDKNDEQNSVRGDDNASIGDDPSSQGSNPSSICGDTQNVTSENPSKKTVRIKLPSPEKPRKSLGTSRLPPLTRSVSVPTFGHAPKGNQSSSPGPSYVSPGRRRPSPSVSDKTTNKWGQSPSVTNSIRRKRNDIPAWDSNAKSTLKLKKKEPSTTTTTLTKGCLKTKKPRETMSPGRSLQKRVSGMSPSPSRCTSTKCGRDSDFNVRMRITRGTLAPLALSPLSPYVRGRSTCRHSSDTESSSKSKRESLSPFAMSPLSSYAKRSSGHLSD